MPFATPETSADDGDIVELFLFRYGLGATEYYAYTGHTEALPMDDPLSEGVITFDPVPIAHDNIQSNGTLDKSALKITTDLGTDLAEIFRVYPPANVVTCTIWQGHHGDPDEEYIVVWAGRIVSAARDNGELIMSGEPVSTSLRRPALRRHYQYGCMHALYMGDASGGCRANKAAATVAATVDSIDGASVTLDAGWEGAFPPAKFLGGLLEYPTPGGSTVSRTILRVTGDTLFLSGVPLGLSASDAVDVVLGCNHRAYPEDNDGDCQALHDNILDYGGCRWIPLKNPFGAFNHYF